MKKHVGHGAAARLLAGLLCLVMAVSMLPAQVLAAPEDQPIVQRVNEIPPIGRYWTSAASEHTFREYQLRFTDREVTHNNCMDGVTYTDEQIERFGNEPYVSLTHYAASEDVLRITGAPLQYLDGDQKGRYFTLVYADDIYTQQMYSGIAKWVDIVIDSTENEFQRGSGFDVYLIDFGKTVTKDNGDEHTLKGLNNITVRGRKINVYLVNCNLGVLKTPALSGEGYSYTVHNPMIASTTDRTEIGNVQLRIVGMDSHIYMDKDTNAEAAGLVACQVCVDGRLPENTYYNPHDGKVWWDENAYAQFGIGPVSDFISTAELSNVRITALGTEEEFFWGSRPSGPYPNGILSGYGGAVLYHCTWEPVIDQSNSPYYSLDKIVLNDHATLSLTDCTVRTATMEPQTEWVKNETTGEWEERITGYAPVYAPITVEMNGRSSLTLSGTCNSAVLAQGLNTLRMDGVQLDAKVTVSNSNDALTTDFVTEEELDDLSSVGRSGAQLDLLLSGDSRIQISDYDAEASPLIMVADKATLTIRDDPAAAGVGALSLGADSSDYYAYYEYGYGSCAAIGGALSMDPKPHGQINIKSGVVNAWTYNGGAAIGGSIKDAVTSYQIEEDGYDLRYEGNPSELLRVYQNTSYGYWYYSETDDRFNPYKGGYWLDEYYGSYYAIDKDRNRVHIPPVYATDANGDPIVESQTPGLSRDAGPVYISGGVVNVTALGGGAGIGGAKGGNGGSFLLNGGTVNAKTSGSSGVAGGAAIGGGAVNWGEPKRTGIGFLSDHDGFTGSPADWNDGIYVDRYTYDPSMGGGSGHIYIYGGVLNACADNMTLNEAGGPIEKAGTYYRADGSVFAEYEYRHWSSELDDYVWDNYYTYTDAVYERSFADGYPSGRYKGYVIGSTCENANGYYENTTEIAKVGGLLKSDGNPVLILSQNKEIYLPGSYYSKTVNLDRSGFYRAPNAEGVMTQDALGRDPDPTDGYHNSLFTPSTVTDGALILLIGWEDTREYEDFQPVSGEAHYVMEWGQIADYYTYRVRGQIALPDLAFCEDESEAFALELPNGATLDLLPGSVLRVPERIMLVAADLNQFVVESGASVTGAGRWPGKPPEPEKAPTTQKVRSLLHLTQSGGGSGGGGEDPITVATHLGIVQTGDGQMVLPANSAETIHSQAEALGLSVLTIFTAGADAFRGETIEGVTIWRLNTRSTDTVISLVENGALSATPDHYTNYRPDLIVRDDNNGSLTVTLQSLKLHTPEYTVFKAHGTDELLTLKPESAKSDLAFTITLDEDQVTNNDAVFSVPAFSGSEFRLDSISPLRDKCAVRYGGALSFSTPFADFANISISRLQLRYGSSFALDGIQGSSSVKVPAIAGFPVSGDAKMTLNTFAPKRQVSLSVNLQTPIFSGAFQTSFKEARGLILPDTLYAELAVEKGGIPLVPPTVIGYLQGGGLGISGLADTVAMDSFGAPPVRLEIAAKGSIIDVISGWIRLSVGLDGFDLSMTNIKVADANFIKEYGISAKWDAGEKVIKGKKYWGLTTDMQQYLVIAVPAMAPSAYGGSADQLPLLFSAKGTVGFGGFTGYYEEDGWLYFIYQLYASSNLAGSVTIPKKLVGGIFPFQTVSLGEAEIGFYASAAATGSVEKSSVNGSPSNVLRQLASSADLDFDAAVGIKLTVGTGAFRFYVRAVYVLGEKVPRFDAGYGSGDDLDLSGLLNASASNSRNYAVIGEIEDPETGEMIPTVVEMAATHCSTLKMSGDESAPVEADAGIQLIRARAVNSFNAEVDASALGSTFLAIRLADESATLSAADVTVMRGDTPVTLVMAAYDEEGNQTNEANFFADEGMAYFAPAEAGTYTITVNGVDIDSVDVIRTTVFASLTQDATALSGSAASYAVQDADADRLYRVQLVFGKEKGAGDYLMAETGLLTGETAYAAALDYETAGSLIPTGDYYPSILLVEYIRAEGENGEIVETWSLVDQKAFDSTIHYENDVIPAAPTGLTLAYSGNGTMTARWTAPVGIAAGAYQLTVYDAEGNDTGLIFQTDDTAIIMDLSSLYTEGGAGQQYCVGVKAVVYDDDSDRANSTYQLGYEARSASAVLAEADPPALRWSDNVRCGDGNSHTLSVGAEGGSFTVSSDRTLTITVTDAAGNVLASGAGVQSLTVDIPADFAAQTLQVLAEDAAAKDYALAYITASVDTAAPPLIPDGLGAYTLQLAEGAYLVNVTGRTEAGASVLVYQKAQDDEDFGSTVAGMTAAEDGSFCIPLVFDRKPDDVDCCIMAVDAAGNASEPMGVTFLDAAVTVILDPNAADAACAVGSIGLAAGEPLGVLPEPFRTDGSMLFDGWYTAPEDGIAIDSGYLLTADVTLYAHWIGAVTLTYHEGGDIVAESPAKQGRPVGALPAPKKPAADGMTFVGWFTASSGGTEVTAESAFNGDQHLYARWSGYVTVKFNAVQGSSPVSELQILTAGPGIITEYPVPEATGYSFDGWYLDDETEAAAGTVYTADTTLTAHWTRNTGTLAVTQESCAYNAPLPDPSYSLPALGADEEWIGAATISYAGTNGTNYLSSAKPTAPGSYEVIVQRDTFERAYIGSAPFTIGPSASVSGTVTGGALTAATVTAQGNAMLIAVSYGSGRQFLGVRMVEIGAECEARSITISGLPKGQSYQLMLVDKTSYVPLCKAWTGRA